MPTLEMRKIALGRAMKVCYVEGKARMRPSFVVREYRPHCKRDGSYIWRKSRDLTQCLSFEELKNSAYGYLAGQSKSFTLRHIVQSFHNIPLTPLETLQAMAKEKKNDEET